MYFTSGSSRAFEKLMQSKPGFDHFDSGEAGAYEDCTDCRHHQPYRSDRFCVYSTCPFDKTRSTIRRQERPPPGKGGGCPNKQAIYVYRDYGLEIEFNVSFEEFKHFCAN